MFATLVYLTSSVQALFGFGGNIRNQWSFPKGMLEATRAIILDESESRLRASLRNPAIDQIEFMVHRNWRYKLPAGQK